jgi:serine/threonine-protein kinase
MIGRLVGNYKILEKIGEGGMGAVWRGVDIMLDREVAIKMLRPELAGNAEIVGRFRSEAVTLARLNHPNIATLYAFLRQGNDFFMVMEYVRGETLSNAIARLGAMHCAQALGLFCQALEGVHHAHQLGIIHRDIKPANVMLTPNGSIKVMDFGIARALSAARMTRTGHLIGTLEYMAPELIQGQGGDVRSDIYALGMLLYEMLAGRLPFESNSDYELMRAQVEAAPPPPRHFAPHLPVAVEQALMRALAKRPDARFQTAADFRAALLSSAQATGARQSQSLANAPLPDGLKETRLASEGVAPPFAPAPSPASQTGQTPASAEPYIKPTRLGGEKSSPPASSQSGQAHSARPAGLPPAGLAGGAAQAAGTGNSERQPGRGIARLLERLDWRHYAGFAAVLLAIISLPFLLVSKPAQQTVAQPANAVRTPPAHESSATPTPATRPESATPAPAKSISDQLMPSAPSGAAASPAAPSSPAPRSRPRRSTKSSGREAEPARAGGDDSAKKEEPSGHKKEEQDGQKEEKKGGIFRKLKKLNPFSRGDKKKD